MPTTVSDVPQSGNRRNPSGLNPRPNPEGRYSFHDVWHRVLSLDDEERVQRPEPDTGEQRRYPPSIPRLQSFFGMRIGVSPRLRAICDTGDQALILNQLVCYWYARSDRGSIRARIIKTIDNRRQRCVAKSYKEWSEETRASIWQQIITHSQGDSQI